MRSEAARHLLLSSAMARRISAMIGILLLLGLVALLVYRVWLHHEKAGEYDSEPIMVRLDSVAINSAELR